MVSKRKNSGEWGMANVRQAGMVNGGWLFGQRIDLSPTLPKGREAPSHERSYVKSVGSESHRSRYQEGSPFPKGRAGDGSSKPKGAASSHLTLNAKSRHAKLMMFIWRRATYAVRRYPGFSCPSYLVLAGSEAPVR